MTLCPTKLIIYQESMKTCIFFCSGEYKKHSIRHVVFLMSQWHDAVKKMFHVILDKVNGK